MELPIEILYEIAFYDIESYKSMLYVPPFARSLDDETIKKFKEKFMVCVNSKWNTTWILNGRLHREDDLPAIIWPYMFPIRDVSRPERQEWYKNGRKHRDNKPADIYNKCYKMWYRNGLLHRDDDLPAIIWNGGRKEWYRDGRKHREDDLPAVTCSNGTKEWWYNGEKHRKNNPAVIRNIGKNKYVLEYWIHGKRINKMHHIIKNAVDRIRHKK